MPFTLALVGNPNVGKTALFNALTGLAFSTGNYPGVTVERKHGALRLDGREAVLIDLPGAYSLAAHSPDEIILVDVLLGQQEAEDPVDALLVVVDASNLERNLYFVSQLLELEKPIVVALNMMDVAARRGIEINIDELSRQLGAPVVPICAHKRIGMDLLERTLRELLSAQDRTAHPGFEFDAPVTSALVDLETYLSTQRDTLGRDVPRLEAFRLLVDQGGHAERRLLRVLGPAFREKLDEIRARAQTNGATLAAGEARARYAWVRGVMEAAARRPATRRRTRSDRLDNVLTHKLYGSVVFLLLMLLVFQSIFSWSAPVMDLVDGAIGGMGETVGALLPEGVLQSLVVDGIFAGVGSVLIFLPQIILLSLFIALLEDFGYMARAAFLMDKLLSWCGLSGQSFLPMMSSFACAIPGIMATRTIYDRRDRFTTILVAPLMSCSARLPVYVVMIAAFVPDRPVAGVLNLQGLTLFGMYCLGVSVAVPVAWLLKRTLFRGEKPPFLLEMPSYKAPQFRTVFAKVYGQAREFVVRAGTLIFAVTILVWALAYFPRSEAVGVGFDAERAAVEQRIPEGAEREEALNDIALRESGEYMRNSFLGRAGRLAEPVFAPLGWDWRIGTAVIASFPAREIIIATLGTLFNLGADTDETSPGLIQTLRAAAWPDGRPLFTLPVAMSIMVFFALCAQCGATLITIRKETGQWRWPAFTFAYMTTLAYLGAMITYQGANALGIGS